MTAARPNESYFLVEVEVVEHVLNQHRQGLMSGLREQGLNTWPVISHDGPQDQFKVTGTDTLHDANQGRTGGHLKFESLILRDHQLEWLPSGLLRVLIPSFERLFTHGWILPRLRN